MADQQTITVDGITFSAREAHDAILIRNWLAGEFVDGFACPPLDSMTDADAKHWLLTAVVNAKKQRQQHVR